MKRWILLTLTAIIGLTVSTAFSAGLIIIDESHWPVPEPRPFPPPRPRPPFWPPPHVFAPLEVSSVKVDTHINDQVAVTAIDQEFFNPNPSRLEGTFVFPIPKGAHIDKFTMEIDGRQVSAELLKADKARGIYEAIVRKLRDPALLEYAGRDVFKVRIFPIEPNSKKRITLSYTELLPSDAGLVSYSLPLNTEKFSAKPVKSVSVRVDLQTKRPLKSIYSPSHAVEVKRDGPDHATAGYEASDVQPNEDFALYFAPEKDEVGVNLLTHKTGDEDGYFLLLACPGVDVSEQQIARKDVAFVLDTSGSMAGKKLDQAKKALQFCVENLNEGDRFEIMRFSTEVEPLFDKLVAASKENRQKAQDFIKDLKPTGGTAIDDALQKALRLAPPGVAGEARIFVVIFLTDGIPTVGVTDEQQILAHVKKANESRTRVFCFGIGTDVNTHLLDKVTEETRAFSQYVLPEEDLEVKVSSFFAKIKAPVLANPTLQFTGDVRATKLYPSPLPDLFKGQQLVLAGRYSGHGSSALVLEGTVNGMPKKFAYDLKFPEESASNEFIPRLWATRRVGYLLDEIRLHGENSELRDEVTDLARKYGIVTPYTAYLIMEDESRREVPLAQRSLPSIERDRGAREEAAKTWSEFRQQNAGDGAVASALAGQALRSADSAAAAPAQASAAFARRYGLASGGMGGRVAVQPPPGTPTTSAAAAPDSSQSRLIQYTQQTQFVAGKSFFQNGSQWVDSAVQKASPQAKRVRLQFGSSEYFAFLAKNPKAQPWLSLGQSVQFVFNETVYEVYE